MTTTQKLGVGLALAVAALLWLEQHDRAVKAQALAEARADSLRVVTAAMTASDAQRVLQDSARADSIAHLVTKARQLSRSAEAQNRRANALLMSLDSMVPQPVVKQIAALKDSVIAVKDSIIHADSAIFRHLMHGKLAADSSARAWRAIAENAQNQLQIALKRARPRFGCTAGISVAGGFGGSAVGPGATCGIRL